MALERGLGRGLGALLGDAALQSQEGGSLSLPISQVEPGLKQPRKRFDEESLQDLADSIRIHGIIQPLTVRRLSSGYYQIIAGERRWRAAKQAGLDEVPAVIIEADDRKVMEIGLIENLQREDLNPIEEAAGFQSLMETYHMTQEEAAHRVSKSRPAVANAMRLLSLPQEVQWLIEQGNLSAGHGRALLSLPTPEEQIAFAEEIMAHIEQLELRIQRMDAYLLEGLQAWQPQLNLLQTIPGMDVQGAAMLLVEIGADMGAFGSAERLASWVGMCPGNNESAGKKKAHESLTETNR